MRLQKIIALAGLASRREAERLIEQGKVSVNGTVVRKLGSLADPGRDRIKVKGRLIKNAEHKVYVLFHKPKGCLTTVRDDQGRKTVMDFMKKIPVRLFPVGRLDFNTEGVLLMTNDGDLAKNLLDAENKVPRTYQVKVRGVPDEKTLQKLARGVPVDGVPTLPLQVTVARVTGKNCFLAMTLVEGKNRHIKKVCEKVGHPVIKIKRIKFGNLDLTGVPPGGFRVLSPREVRALRALATPKTDA